MRILLGFLILMSITIGNILVLKYFVKAKVLKIILGTFITFIIFLSGYMVIAKNDMKRIYQFVKSYIRK